MWLATQYGFYSVVKIRKSEDYFIRARKKNDLTNVFPKDRVITTYDSDYWYRVVVSKTELNSFMEKVSDIEYTNFKDHIKTTEQKDKMVPYNEIWYCMYVYQSGQEK